MKRCVVIAAEYAGFEDARGDILPDAEKKCLIAAFALAKEQKALLVWGNSEKPGPGASLLHEAKLKYLKTLGAMTVETRHVVSNNTIQEVSKLWAAMKDYRPEKVFIVCDRFHTRRYHAIARSFFPKSIAITMVPVPGKWDEGHPSPWQRSAFRWWLCNFIFLTLMRTYERLGMQKSFFKKYERRTHVSQ